MGTLMDMQTDMKLVRGNMEIKRYNVGYMGLEEHPKGRFVSHGDYLEEVKQLEDRIAYLEKELLDEYERGFFNGSCTGYGQG